MNEKIRAQWENIANWLGRRLSESKGMGPADAAVALSYARKLFDDLKLLVDEYVETISSAEELQGASGRDRNLMETEDGDTVAIKRGKPAAKWVGDDDALLAAVIARGADMRRVDRETGEIVEREGDAVGRVLAKVWSLKVSNARKGELAEIGLDKEEFREKVGETPGKVEVTTFGKEGS